MKRRWLDLEHLCAPNHQIIPPPKPTLRELDGNCERRAGSASQRSLFFSCGGRQQGRGDACRWPGHRAQALPRPGGSCCPLGAAPEHQEPSPKSGGCSSAPRAFSRPWDCAEGAESERATSEPRLLSCPAEIPPPAPSRGFWGHPLAPFPRPRLCCLQPVRPARTVCHIQNSRRGLSARYYYL